MEFDEHEDQEDEIGGIQVPPNYDLTPAAARKGSGGAYRYRECLKNHAVGIGGHAVDGCGEFMPAGEDGTLDALKCAACNCHRNFHRKEAAEGEGFHHPHPHPHPQQPPHHHHHHHHQFPPNYYRTGPHPAGYLQVTPPPHHQMPLALPSTSREEEDVSNPSSSGGGGGGGGGGSKKRFRTKFTQEQKEKMLELAERLEWRIQKQDEAAVEQFCEETGVKRHVLKVWMHNNKHTLGKKP